MYSRRVYRFFFSRFPLHFERKVSISQKQSSRSLQDTHYFLVEKAITSASVTHPPLPATMQAVVTKARECLSELGALQILLRQATPAAFDGGPPPFTATDGSHSVEGERSRGCSDAHGHGRLHSDARSHARAHPQLERNVNAHGDREKAVCCSDRCPSEAGEDALVGAVKVLRSATVAVRITEGNCLLRAGRAAQATEALRDLLLEVC